MERDCVFFSNLKTRHLIHGPRFYTQVCIFKICRKNEGKLFSARQDIFISGQNCSEYSYCSVGTETLISDKYVVINFVLINFLRNILINM